MIIKRKHYNKYGNDKKVKKNLLRGIDKKTVGRNIYKEQREGFRNLTDIKASILPQQFANG